MIRRFQEKDVGDVSKIILNCVNESSNLTPENRKFMLTKTEPENILQKARDIELYVNELNGVVIGTGALDGNEIRTMFVEPSIQGKGHGREIILFLIQKAKEYHSNKVWLKSSTIAEKFYEKLKFKKVRDRYDFNLHTIEMELYF